MIYEQEKLEKVLSVLRTPKELRSEEDLGLLWPLMTCIPAIQALHSDIRSELLGNLVLLTVETGQEIRLEEGDAMVLLEGSGKLWGLRSAGRDNEKKTGKRELETEEDLGRVRAGDYVGKEARQGVVLTALRPISPLSLCSLPAAQLLALQHQSYLLSLQDKLLFLRSLPLFSGWSKSLLSKLSAHMQVCNYRKGEVIYRETDPVREVYFLVEGEVMISKSFGVVLDAMELRKLNSHSPKREPLLSPLICEGKVCIKQAKELFGDEEDSKSGLRAATSTCISAKATCYSIPKTEFSRKVGNPATLAFLSHRKRLEKEWVKTRLRSLHNAERLKLQSFFDFEQKDCDFKADISGKQAFKHRKACSTPKPKAIYREESRSRSIFLTADTSTAATPEPKVRETAQVSGNGPERRLSTLSPLRDISPGGSGPGVTVLESPVKGKICPVQGSSPFLPRLLRPHHFPARPSLSKA